MQPGKPLSLGSRVALIIIGGSLLAVIAIVATAYQGMVKDFENLLTQRQILEAERTSDRVNQKLQLRLNALSALAGQLASENRLPSPADLEEALGRQTNLRDLLPGGLLVFDEEARAVAENIYVPDRIGTQYLDRPHFQEALRHRRPIVSKPMPHNRHTAVVVSGADRNR